MVGCVHTAYLHIDPRMLTLVAGRCHGGLVCMASGREMAYCVLCVCVCTLCIVRTRWRIVLSEARTWLCPAPRMGGLDHGPGGPVRLKLKRSNQTKDGNQRHCRYIWRCPVTKMGCFDQRTLGRPGKMACE